ncbi:MAG: hypothetical protein ACLPXU_09935 [Acidimicrobiales bacterium]
MGKTSGGSLVIIGHRGLVRPFPVVHLNSVSGCQEFVERWPIDRLVDLVLVDVELFEDRLIQKPPLLWRHLSVQPLRISEQSKGLFDQPDTDLQSSVAFSKSLGDLIPLALDGRQALLHLIHGQPALGR